MSSQLASIVPLAPLTDDVFPFNKDAFTEIRRYQQELVSYSYLKNFNALTDCYNFPRDLAFLQSPVIIAYYYSKLMSSTICSL